MDEWCNTAEDIEEFVAAGAADVVHVKATRPRGLNATVESLLLVRRRGLLAYCGGTWTAVATGQVIGSTVTATHAGGRSGRSLATGSESGEPPRAQAARTAGGRWRLMTSAATSSRSRSWL